MPDEVRVRAAVSEDAAALAELCGQLGYPTTAETVAAQLPLLALPHYALFVAERDVVIGWIQVQGKVSLHAGRFAEITGLVVDEGHRGQGIGTLLLARVEAWAGQHGYPQVWLRSNVKRNQAHSFYQRHGYELIKTSYTFRKPLATTAVQVKAV
jgi:GNAT superfamily N-acetyltransferase